MQKYLKITGLTAGVNTESLVPVNGVSQLIPDATAPLNFLLVRYFSSHNSGDIITLATPNATAEELVELANFFTDLIIKVNQQKYTEPYLEIAATDFPVQINNVVIN